MDIWTEWDSVARKFNEDVYVKFLGFKGFGKLELCRDDTPHLPAFWDQRHKIKAELESLLLVPKSRTVDSYLIFREAWDRILPS